MDETPYKGFYIRLRPEARKLLDQAQEATGKARVDIIHDLIYENLVRFQSLEERLDKLIAGRRV
jgi:predicted DNA-binding protein